MKRDEYEAVAAKLDGNAWPKLDPLPEVSTPKPKKFPLKALGPLAGLAALATARDVQAPDSLAAGSVLAAAALAAQPHADVLLPHGQRAPLSLNIITGAGSGDRKSATDQVACWPVEEYRNEQARDYATAQAEYEAAKASRRPGDAPVTPPCAQTLKISKSTTEGMHLILRHQSHLGLFTAEGGEVLAGHSMREERKAAGQAWLLKAWSGETLDALTRGDGLSVLPGRRVSMHLMVQPILLRQLLADPLASGQGLLARCLIAEPDTLAGTRKFRAVNVMESKEVKAFHAKLKTLLNMKPPLHPDGDGFELQPRLVKMSKEATALWVEFYDNVEELQADGGELAGARAWASKAGEHAARIAGVITILADPLASEIDLKTMAGAVEVTQFYLHEHVRLMGVSVEAEHLKRLHVLVEFLRERGPIVSNNDVLQRSPRAVRNLKAEGVKTLLKELTERGYVRPVGDGWEVRSA